MTTHGGDHEDPDRIRPSDATEPTGIHPLDRRARSAFYSLNRVAAVADNTYHSYNQLPLHAVVKRAGANYRVSVEGAAADALESVQFGWFYDANRQVAAEPRPAENRGNRTTFLFPADETEIDTPPGGPDGDVRVRFLARRAETGRVVRGTATVEPDGHPGGGR